MRKQFQRACSESHSNTGSTNIGQRRDADDKLSSVCQRDDIPTGPTW